MKGKWAYPKYRQGHPRNIVSGLKSEVINLLLDFDLLGLLNPDESIRNGTFCRSICVLRWKTQEGQTQE